MHLCPPLARAMAVRAAASLLLWSLVACQRQPSSSLAAPVSQRGAPIVGGEVDTGWSGVGALTVVLPLDGYLGSFCTATLIAPSWALTAAHCVTRREGPDLDPALLRFLVGADARPASADGPIDGALYALDAIRVHPEYDRATLAHDLALVHLATPASDADTYAAHTGDLTITGQEALYVGYGATEGVSESGAGLKRSALVEVTRLSATSITSAFAGTGTCFGDSGGPVLFQFGDVWRLVGVSSAGVYCDPAYIPNCPPDPCHTQSIATRVDPYADWIAEVVATPLVTTGPWTCAEVYACIAACPTDACANTCFEQGTAEAQGAYLTLTECLDTRCPDLTGAPFRACVDEQCGDARDACLPPSPPQDCDDDADACAPADAAEVVEADDQPDVVAAPETTEALDGTGGIDEVDAVDGVDAAAPLDVDDGPDVIADPDATSDAVADPDDTPLRVEHSPIAPGGCHGAAPLTLAGLIGLLRRSPSLARRTRS